MSAAGRVIGYYVIATGAVARAAATGRVRRNMPDPVPVMVLGRLAVDSAYQGRGLGVGFRAILVHAMSEEARRFCERHGFGPSPIDPMTLMITIADAKGVIGR